MIALFIVVFERLVYATEIGPGTKKAPEGA